MKVKNILIPLLFVLVTLPACLNLLKEDNSEKTFMSIQDIELLEDYESKFGAQNSIFLTSKNPELQEEDFRHIYELKMQYPFEFYGPKELTNQESWPEAIKQLEKAPKEFILKNKLYTFLINFKDLTKEKQNLIIQELVKNNHFYLNGTPYINYSLNLESQKLQSHIFPILFISLFILLLIFIKDVKTTLFLFFLSLVAVPITQAVIILIYENSNILTNSSPLITFVLNLSLNLHIYYSTIVYKNLETVYKKKKTPILLMLFTTLTGFLSLAISNLAIIQSFAIIQALSLFLSVIFSFGVWYYAFQDKIEFDSQFKQKNQSKRLNRKVASLITFATLLLSPFFFQKISYVIDAYFFFPDDHPVKENTEIVIQELGGFPQFEFLVSSKELFRFKDYLALEKIQDEINQNYHSYSLIDFVKWGNYLYTDNYSLPKFSTSFFVLRNQVPQSIRKSLNHKNHFKLTVFAPPIDAELAKREQDLILTHLRSKYSVYNFELSGPNHLLLKSQGELLPTLLKSFMISFSFVSLIAGFFLRNKKDFLIFVLVNFSTLCLGVIAFYITNISFNVATVMTFSISFGLVVDGTLHILFSHKNEDSSEMRSIGVYKPIFITNICLLICFFVMGFHNFYPVSQFGKALFVLLLSGLFFDLIILPSLKSNK